MKKLYRIFLVIFIFSGSVGLAQNRDSQLWFPVKESLIPVNGVRQIIPQKYATFSLSQAALWAKLSEAPHERNVFINNSTCIISLPLPDGEIQQFRVVESPVMAPELAASFPEIRTYSIKGLDDPYANGKIDWNEFGFHAMVLRPSGDFFIDPYCVRNTGDYMSYYTSDFVKKASQRVHEEGVEGAEEKPANAVEDKTGLKQMSAPPAVCVGEELRTYRLAVACTGEYAKASTGSAGTVIPTVAQVLSKIVTTINRVDGVYEREVAIRMVLVPTQTLIIFTDPGTDPFTGNNNPGTLIGESQTVISSTIGTPNYDIGHTFSTGGGGLAHLGSVCVNSVKARGITGSSNPVGDPYDIDYVAHEIGHQFRANHSFNAGSGGCVGNRSAATAVEPGSGITIMAYAGLCPGNNIANNSIAYFHAINYDEIVNYTHTGNGSNCPVITSTGNNYPFVSVSNNHIVPKGTPFVLSGSGVDSDGDKLFYSWEEMDVATAAGSWNSGKVPFFRSYPPDTVNPVTGLYSRLFPRKSVIVNGNYTGTMGEYLPQSEQTLNFRLTVRDNKMGGGGVCYAMNTVTVDNSGPLHVSYPSNNGIVWPVASSQTIIWDVNGTNMPPVSCDSVSIWISYDSGNTYTKLIHSTPNDGSESISVPTLTSTIKTCRIKVESIGNIFYDVSNFNFTISDGTEPTGIPGSQVSQNNPLKLTVWPNPFTENINFAAAHLNSNSITEVKVTDIAGRTIRQYAYKNKSELRESLDLSGLSKGVYFIRVHNGNFESVNKIVKD